MSALPPLISVNEARRLLGGRGRGRIYELLASGDLESVVDGSRRFVVSESVTRYIERLRSSSQRGLKAD